MAQCAKEFKSVTYIPERPAKMHPKRRSLGSENSIAWCAIGAASVPKPRMGMSTNR